MRRATSTNLPRNRLKVAVAAAGLAMGLAACPGSLDDPAAFLEAGATPDGQGSGSSGDAGSADDAATGMCPTAGDVPTTVFIPTCTTANCHDATSKAQGLDLVSSGVAARLVNRPSTEQPTQMLVNPKNPDQSYLLIKLSLAKPPAGARMPYFATPLTADQIQCVRAWIATQ